MTQEEKSLLLKDLCARLPYGVIMTNKMLTETYYPLDGNEWQAAYYDDDWDDVPYLRPMSSMTEEEKHKLLKFGAITCLENGEVIDVSCIGFERHADVQDYLNTCHLDYRGLIPKGLAIEVTEENNPYKL